MRQEIHTIGEQVAQIKSLLGHGVVARAQRGGLGERAGGNGGSGSFRGGVGEVLGMSGCEDSITEERREIAIRGLISALDHDVFSTESVLRGVCVCVCVCLTCVCARAFLCVCT